MHEPTIGIPGGDDLASDPRVLQILSAEHNDLLSARGLAYNESFTRGGIFLTFLSTSFVALALLAQAMGFNQDFLVVAAIIVVFSFLIGIATFARIIDIVADDLRAMHGMNRIRRGYIEIAPLVAPYLVNSAYDDLESVMSNYNPKASSRSLRGAVYGLSTSLGLIGLIVALVGGTLASVVTLAAGGTGWLALATAIVATLIVLGGLARWAGVEILTGQAGLQVRFPAPGQGERSQPAR